MKKQLFSAITLAFCFLTLFCDCKTGMPRAAAAGNPQSTKQFQLDYLRCEYLSNPLGINVKKPRLSWIINSSERGQKQTAYRILVSENQDLLNNCNGTLWDSGKVFSEYSTQIIYRGKPLTSYTRCFWKVMAWDKDGNPSPWSKTGMWSMGPLSKTDWKAKWIGLDYKPNPKGKFNTSSLDNAQWIWFPEENPRAAAEPGKVYFRRIINIKRNAKIKKATCLLTCDNGFKFFVNGKELSSGQNFKLLQFVDITKQLHSGDNIIAASAHNDGDTKNPAGLIAAIIIDFNRNHPLLITTGSSWLVSRANPSGWQKKDFDSSSWKPAKELGKHGISPWGKLDVTANTLYLPPPKYLRKDFTLQKPVRRATVYATALGLFQLHLNGKQVSEDYFTPGFTDYNIRVYYKTYDVTNLVCQGKNSIGAILADGWYAGYIGWGRKRNHYGKNPRFNSQLRVEYTDGSVDLITSDATWKASTGPIQEADFLMGETYDARLEIPGWSGPAFDDSTWKPVEIAKNIDIKIEPHPGVPVRIFKEITPKKITEPEKGTYVFNLGTNFAGFARLKARCPEGQKITLRFAERLNPDGTIYTTNLRGARATDTYICKGGTTEIWQPNFTYHGFQYVELKGLPFKPNPETITGIELSSSTPQAGSFKTSDSLANTLYRNICQTQRANFMDIPTDCPQRDERLGWTGDAQIYVRSATYNSDVSAFYTKWLVDLEDAQLPNGAFTDVAPRMVATGGGTAAWGDAGVICPWTLYKVYGDKRVLAKYYRAMARWIEYCKSTTKNLLRPSAGYGDWLSIKADTPKDVLATAYFAYSTSLMARMAKALEKHSDEDKYNKLFDAIKRAFIKAYVSEDGKIKGDTQTVYVLALAFDLLPGDKRPLAEKHLLENIKNRRFHLSTGFVGTKDLMMTLTKIGRTDIAYRLFHNVTFPSWGFSIKHGATSIWERWDGWTPDKGFQNPGMNSFAHYSFGAVCEWMFKTIGGIDSEDAGYNHIIIKPIPDSTNIKYADVSYNSIRGIIKSSWKITGDKFILNVTIPAGTSAKVYIPAEKADNISEKGNFKEAVFLHMEGKTAVYNIGSGTYCFTSKSIKL